VRDLVIGVFATYEDATQAVQGLEAAGIIGDEVELITDVDEDAEIPHPAPETSTEARESNVNRIARLFGKDGGRKPGEVAAAAGETPEYLGDEEFYATHVRQGGAVVIVRPSSEVSAARATAILRSHDARFPGEKQQRRGPGTGKSGTS